jgi:LemA protein
MTALWVVLGIVVLGVLIVLGTWKSGYNKLVVSDEQLETAWAQVETVLQRRYDLIPNLVNTVKGYSEHEKGVFENITRLRSQWGAAKNVGEKIEASSQLEGAIGRLIMVSERYPDLKANQNFIGLQDELAGTENRIATERRRYNLAVQVYNSTVRKFPSNIIAGMHGFERKASHFEADEGAKEVPKVEF